MSSLHSRPQAVRTVFGSLRDFQKGELEIIDDDPAHYAFSNVFEVAARSRPWEKVVVALNLGYVIEAVRAEGRSGWYAASHDEFAIVLDGTVRIELVRLEDPDGVAPPEQQGTVPVSGTPLGRPMGYIRAWRGHQALLPRGAAYRFEASEPGVLLMQTILGPLSVQKWADICVTRKA